MAQLNTDYATFFDDMGQNDRLYDSADLRDYFSKFFANGVFGRNTIELAPVATGGMQIKINAGSCFINGAKRNFKDTTVTLNYGNNTYGRYDAIVLRYDEVVRNITIEVIEGTPATVATFPAPVRTATTYDLVLAHIYVPVGVSDIEQKHIYDRRGQTEYCPYVTTTVKQIDTTALFKQYDAAWNDFIQALSTADKEHIHIYAIDTQVRTDVAAIKQSMPFSNHFNLI